MLTHLFRELALVSRLALKHWQTLLIVCIATLVMIIEQTPKLGYRFTPYSFNAFMYYGVFPLLLLVAIQRKNPLKLGLGLGDIKFWLPASILYLLIAIPVTLVGTANAQIDNYYDHNNLNFIKYGLNTALYMLGWEYFFRGFLIEGLRKTLREGAIIVQMIPFTLLHLGKPDAETISCIFSGLIWGYICYRARSFWPAFVMHMMINLCLTAQINGHLF